MPKFVELDDAVTLHDQLNVSDGEPVILVNLFHVAAQDVDQLLRAWADDAAFFKAQPGFISTQLHRGIAGSCTFLNYAIWESVEAFRTAFGNPVFQSKLAAYPSSATASPHLFRKLAVANICVA
ncbi:antibiotic biosynthesis monooxygenase family protein [Beijerinckia indica]|uniref:Antibiotic biosynthesis monooxygenase n=1 Tax=Beijerinckia indica subsp. indica (strain ATCC 9039 / DSM 1715 / NCIMB 8712) TaxID=395963 RepID=B2IGS1_BEII9|nr:antibiotic biosynthesis monooxygenase family protein [Beijerinckia indica]ACB95832.1 Antibiotic biosynthesis monooxygenase [Beijerinckia indica subsp. indica ATCC 9039]